MKKFFWILLILAVLSCTKEEKLPEGYMNEQQMISFLVDLHTAQAALQNLRLDTDSAAYLFKVFEKQILEKHEAKDSVFYESFSWYLDHPEMMYEIYTAVVDTISLRESLARKTE